MWISSPTKGDLYVLFDLRETMASRWWDRNRYLLDFASRHFSQSRRWSPVGYRPVGFGGRFRGVMMRLGWSRRA
jgi:hypothetical protein